MTYFSPPTLTVLPNPSKASPPLRFPVPPPGRPPPARPAGSSRVGPATDRMSLVLDVTARHNQFRKRRPAVPDRPGLAREIRGGGHDRRHHFQHMISPHRKRRLGQPLKILMALTVELLVRSTNPTVSVWEPDELNTALEDAGHTEHIAVHACAVVSFNDEKSATSAHIKHAKAMAASSESLSWAGGDLQTGVRAEPLSDAFACLLVAEKKKTGC